MVSQSAIAHDYETSEELAPSLAEVIGDSLFYSVKFSKFEIVKEALELILAVITDRSDRVWMDTDHGAILPGREAFATSSR